MTNSNNDQTLTTVRTLVKHLEYLSKLAEEGGDTQVIQAMNEVKHMTRGLVTKLVDSLREQDRLKFEADDARATASLLRADLNALRNREQSAIISEVAYELTRFFHITPNDAERFVKTIFGLYDLGPYYNDQIQEIVEDISRAALEEDMTLEIDEVAEELRYIDF